MKNRNVTFTTIFLAVGCLALCQQAPAISPAPDGCYPGFTTAEGCKALNSLTTGAGNAGVGWYSLYVNTTGNYNTGVGAGTLVLNNGDSNTAVGTTAMLLNSDGHDNTAIGRGALLNNTIGFGSVAAGVNALYNNTEGNRNVAVGAGALFNNTTGIFNIALGWGAGQNLTTGNNNITIFADGVAGDANTIRIGTTGLHTATYIAGISGATASSGVQVFVNTDGRLGTLTSSARFKEEVKPMDQASEAILAFKPVTFRYKKEMDPKSVPQFGLVAEDVEKINPDLVVRDKEGKPYSVRYDLVNAMLLYEFLKEHKKVEEQQETIAELKSIVALQQKEFQTAIAEQRREIESVVARLKEQDTRIQRVNDELEMNGTIRQVVTNKP